MKGQLTASGVPRPDMSRGGACQSLDPSLPRDDVEWCRCGVALFPRRISWGRGEDSTGVRRMREGQCTITAAKQMHTGPGKGLCEEEMV